MGTRQVPDNRLQATLKQIQFRLQVAEGRELTHGDLAEMAGVGARSLGDWMRGVTSPAGMNAVLKLLAILPTAETAAVLQYWQDCGQTAVAKPVKISRNKNARLPRDDKVASRKKHSKERS